MSKIAFIYPGQGAQAIGMGKDFYDRSEAAKKIYEESSAACGLDLASLCFNDNDKLDITEYTQPAMVATCLAMTAVFMEQTGIRPDVCAGLSLGEYAAIATCGALSAQQAVALVRKRGILMEHAVPTGEGAMSAVIGMEAEGIAAITETIGGVSIANYNCPGQIVITGEKAAVEAAGIALKEAGARRVLPLKVSGPFHSPMLKGAGAELRKELESVAFDKLEIPYITNVTADYVEDSSEIKELLVSQISSSVCWEQSLRRLIADGVETFIEIGPGKTLSGFLRKIDKSVKVRNISKWEDMQNE
ncbi:[acyl-carrier-protein] S-malonyltransferase [Lachnospiraceae bacterium PF1-21]|uniref:ACP S-malonyltransferase n=1 Tax=Ohessyouella blattaphilus TaxID=2949333 RepID=UPI003E265183